MALSDRDKAIVDYTAICVKKQFSDVVAKLARDLGEILKDIDTEEAFEIFAEALEALEDEATK